MRLASAAVGGIALLTLTSCYYLSQGLGLARSRAGARGIDAVLADPGTEESTRRFLTLTEGIRRFARDELGLAPSRNYTTFIKIERDYLADVVSACEATSFTTYYWSYPFMGPLPYRGFFDEDSAQKEAEGLRALGYDVLVRKVDAFSTLGFLQDPLYSFMESYSEQWLCELIVHELTHATIFVKGESAFNEEAATFIGRKASFLWLSSRYGENSPHAEAARTALADGTAFAGFLREVAEKLEKVYSSSASIEDKLAAKRSIIDAEATRFLSEYESRFATDRYRSFPVKTLDNAYLDLYRLYEGEPNLYEELLRDRCSGDLKAFVLLLREVSASGASMKPKLEAMLSHP